MYIVKMIHTLASVANMINNISEPTRLDSFPIDKWLDMVVIFYRYSDSKQMQREKKYK